MTVSLLVVLSKVKLVLTRTVFCFFMQTVSSRLSRAEAIRLWKWPNLKVLSFLGLDVIDFTIQHRVLVGYISFKRLERRQAAEVLHLVCDVNRHLSVLIAGLEKLLSDKAGKQHDDILRIISSCHMQASISLLIAMIEVDIVG